MFLLPQPFLSNFSTNIRAQLRSDLRSHTRKKGTTLEAAKLQERRNALQRSIDTFNQKASLQFLQGETSEDPWVQLPSLSGHESDTDVEDISEDEEDPNPFSTPAEPGAADDDAVVSDPESAILLLPSNIPVGTPASKELGTYKDQEIELRLGKLNDSLQGLRLALAHKSLYLRTQVRHSKSQSTRTRAWAAVDKESSKASKHMAEYNRSREAIVRLSPNSPHLSVYKAITKEDLKMKGSYGEDDRLGNASGPLADVLHENRLHQRNHILPWFWQLDGKSSGEMEDGTWIQECMFYLNHSHPRF